MQKSAIVGLYFASPRPVVQTIKMQCYFTGRCLERVESNLYLCEAYQDEGSDGPIGPKVLVTISSSAMSGWEWCKTASWERVSK